MTIHNSTSELIGNTPLIKLKTASPNASSTQPNAAANSSRAA